MDEVIQITKDVSFNSYDYIINVKAQSDVLVIELEQKYDTSFWRNTFTASYIEELTQKTGNRKNFADFVRLLVASLKNPNLSQLSLDILTQQDLENLKAKKTQQPQPVAQNQSSNANIAKINKRYVILSSMSQSEKVHYPLSLNFEENQDPEKLKSTIKKLKMELEEQKSHAANGLEKSQKSENSFFVTENLDKKYSTNSSINNANQPQHSGSHHNLGNSMTMDQLRSENELLKSKVKRMEETLLQKKGAIEMDQIIKDKFEMEEQFDLLRKSHSMEVDRLRQALDQREAELQNKKREIFELKKELTQSFEGDEAGKRLRAHILKLSEESERELQSSRKTITNQQKEIDKLSLELDSLKQLDRKAKNRIKQLEIELETATKRGALGGSTRGLSDRLYSPYNKGGTPTNSSLNGRRANSVPAKSYSPSNRTLATGSSRGTTPTSSKTNFNNRTPSNDALKNKMSPSYNYNFKRQTAVQSATNIQGGQANKISATNTRNSPSSRLTGSLSGKNQITNLSRQSPVSRIQSTNLQKNSPSNPKPANNNIFIPNNPAISGAAGRVSPAAQRYTTQKQKNVSPGTRYNSYMSSRNTAQQGPQQVNKEFSDKHLSKPIGGGVGTTGGSDLDSRLDKLQSLLIQAKK